MFFGPGGIPRFGVNTPLPHSAPNAQTSPFYKNPFLVNPNRKSRAPPVSSARMQSSLPQFGTDYKGGGDYFLYNFAAVTPALPPADRQSFYGSFVRDICDKYLQVFADFKYVRSFFDTSLAAVPFARSFKIPGTNIGFSPFGISVPIRIRLIRSRSPDTTVLLTESVSL